MALCRCCCFIPSTTDMRRRTSRSSRQEWMNEWTIKKRRRSVRRREKWWRHWASIKWLSTTTTKSGGMREKQSSTKELLIKNVGTIKGKFLLFFHHFTVVLSFVLFPHRELSYFPLIPHLLFPLITERPKQAPWVAKWIKEQSSDGRRWNERWRSKLPCKNKEQHWHSKICGLRMTEWRKVSCQNGNLQLNIKHKFQVYGCTTHDTTPTNHHSWGSTLPLQKSATISSRSRD